MKKIFLRGLAGVLFFAIGGTIYYNYFLSDSSLSPVQRVIDGSVYKLSMNGANIGTTNNWFRIENIKSPYVQVLGCNSSEQGIFCDGNLKFEKDTKEAKVLSGLGKTTFTLYELYGKNNDGNRSLRVDFDGTGMNLIHGNLKQENGKKEIEYSDGFGLLSFDRTTDLIAFGEWGTNYLGDVNSGYVLVGKNINTGFSMENIRFNVVGFSGFSGFDVSTEYGPYPSYSYDVDSLLMPLNFTMSVSGYNLDISKFSAVLTDSDGKKLNVVSSLEKGKIMFDINSLKKDSQNSLNISYGQENIIITFKTLGDFREIANQNNAIKNKNFKDGVVSIDDSSDNIYTACFSQPLDEIKTTEALYVSIGSGNISYINYSVSLTQFGGSYGVHNCVSFTYLLNPLESHDFDVSGITSLLGERTSIKVTLFPYALKSTDVYSQVVGEKFTVLPTLGYWGNKVQISYKNIKDVSLLGYSCELNDVESIGSLLKKGNENSNYKNVVDEMFSCQKVGSFPLTFGNFEWWKMKAIDVDLKILFGREVPKIFALQINGNGEMRYFVQNNFGIYVKKSQEELYVWVNDLKKGRPLANVNSKLTYVDLLGNSSILEQKFTEYTKFTIPKNFDFGILSVENNGENSYLFVGGNSPYQYYGNGGFNNPFSNYSMGSAYFQEKSIQNLYAYTDRVLYKKGDKVYVSGWTRDKKNKDQFKKGKVVITVTNLDVGQEVFNSTVVDIDEFGGFKNTFSIGDGWEFGNYSVAYSIDGDSYAQFSSFFTVQEYKKNLYDVSLSTMNDLISVVPTYYFGPKLTNYDLILNYSFYSRLGGIYDRNYCGKDSCDVPMIYSYLLDDTSTTGGRVSLQSQNGEVFFSPDLNITTPQNLYIQSSIFDNKSQSSLLKSAAFTLYPEYLVGIYDYSSNWKSQYETDYLLRGKVLQKVTNDKFDLKNYSNVSNYFDKVSIELYYSSYENEQSMGLDGEYYNDNIEKNELISKGTTTLNKDSTYAYNLELTKLGKYTIKVSYKGFSTISQIYTYEGTNPESLYYGSLGNNINLKVNSLDKNYIEGDEAELFIDPYINGASVIVTVESEGNMLYKKQQILDGKPIKIKVGNNWYPNVNVSVAQIVGEDFNAKVSDKRSEPRFYVGNTTIKIDEDEQKLKFDTKIYDEKGKIKTTFKPGETVIVKIKSTDLKGFSIQSRISVGVIDKALIDLYDVLKKPLQDFYTYVDNGFQTYSTYHLLYKALRVMSDGGTKGGGGSSLPDIGVRDNYEDVAYWRGGEITNQSGEIEFKIILPQNLTTRVVELIGISKNGKIGFQRDLFKVSKDVIINANVPNFIGLYDQVEIPISLLSTNNKIDLKLLKTQVTIQSKTYTLGYKNSNDSTVILDMNKFLIDDLLQSDFLTLKVTYGNLDAVQYRIPLRKEGFYKRSFSTFFGDYFSGKLVTGNVSFAIVKSLVGLLPSGLMGAHMDKLIGYEYGCTEQLLTSLYGAVYGNLFAQSKMLESTMISGGKISTYSSEKNTFVEKTVQDYVSDKLGSIYARLDSKNLIKFWLSSQEGGDISLSIYSYHVLNELVKRGYSIDKNFVNKLSQGIQTAKLSSTQRLHFFMVRSMAGEKIDQTFVDELLDKEKGNYIHKVLGYVGLVYQGNRDLGLENELYDYFRNNFSVTKDYEVFYQRTILKSFFIRALLKNGEKEKAYNYLKELSLVNPNDATTQENIQILLAFYDFIQYNKLDSSLNFSLGINKSSIDRVISGFAKNSQNDFVLKDQPIDFVYNGSQDSVLSFDVKYLTNEKLVDKKQGVKEFYGKVSVDDKQIGDIVPFEGKFSLEKDVQHLAVVYSIPSNTQFSSLVTNQSNYYDLNIRTSTVGGQGVWYNCQPTSVQRFYDRVFLYYTSLPAGATCDVSFDVIKTHNGKVIIPNHSLFEMYGKDVFALDYY